jgi:hypothetical protein
MLPSALVHEVAAKGTALAGVSGEGLATTLTVDAGEVQPATDCVTDTIYVPGCVGTSVLFDDVEVPRPAPLGAVQVNVNPDVFVTDSWLVAPTQTGFGFASKFNGALGELTAFIVTDDAADVHPFTVCVTITI